MSPEESIETFKLLKTARDVAYLLEVEYSTLTYYLYRRPIKSNYRIFALRKKNGGVRHIFAPITPLILMQRRLNEVLQIIYKPKSSVNGFVKGKSVLTNAQTHVRKSLILNLDLENFFPSINYGRVRGMFMSKPYKVAENASTVLAQICCVDGHLAQGAPTSPIISNMICGKLDSDLQKIARKYRCTYSRYADDITYSTSKYRFPYSMARLIYDDEKTYTEIGDHLQSVIENNGFRINLSKVRISGKGNRQEVTGIVVNADSDEVGR
jgi:RNA-directed DNA polymerase